MGFERGPGGRSECSDSEERREAPRLDKAFPVWLEGDRGGSFGVARNISQGGMFIETAEPQPLGSQVQVTFSSSAGDMTAIAEVRYVCHLLGRLADGASKHAALRGMGVRFLYFEASGEAPSVTH